MTDPALDIGKFLADLEWWFTRSKISGVEAAQGELLKGYSEGRESDQAVHERLERAKLFHVLILIKIVVRRVPIYKQEWSVMTSQMIDQAARVLHKVVKA